MKIALINPEAPINRFDIKGFLGEPLGILYIASMLERHGHEVKVFDLQMNPNLNLSREIDHYEPNIIGITSMTANFSKAEKVAKLSGMERFIKSDCEEKHCLSRFITFLEKR